MSELFHKAIRLGLKKGADQLEIFALEGYTDVVQFEKNAIFASESKTITGIGIRAYSNKGLGIATSSMMDKESVKEIVEMAVKLSKLSPSDDLFESLPGPFTKYPKVEGLNDKGICELPAESLTEMTIEAIDNALEKQKVIVSGNFKRVAVTETIYNSLGVEVSQNLSSLTGVLFAKAEVNSDIATSWDYQKVRKKEEFDPARIGRVAAKNAVSLLGSKKVKSQEIPVILDNRSTLDTISSIVAAGLDAYEVILGTAFFKDRLGEQVTIDKITVKDNPLYPRGVGSARFDDEGVPHKELVLIEKGIAKAYFSNSYCANVLGMENTAHAQKNSLGSKPHPDLTQIQIEPGDSSVDEMISETKKGIYLKDSALEPSAGSPNISVLIDQGFLIKDGEISHPLKETMVGTNIFELLNNIIAVSKELINESGSISPAIKIEKATIAGGK
ncbi:MAG TPA: TldD/PmbA family protein [candidate division Zixibacteria bacterium]|nr:TldD/PmbA family protein [candidate division Zixibacteria bacterium]